MFKWADTSFLPYAKGWPPPLPQIGRKKTYWECFPQKKWIKWLPMWDSSYSTSICSFSWFLSRLLWGSPCKKTRHILLSFWSIWSDWSLREGRRRGGSKFLGLQIFSSYERVGLFGRRGLQTNSPPQVTTSSKCTYVVMPSYLKKLEFSGKIQKKDKYISWTFRYSLFSE